MPHNAERSKHIAYSVLHGVQGGDGRITLCVVIFQAEERDFHGVKEWEENHLVTWEATRYQGKEIEDLKSGIKYMQSGGQLHQPMRRGPRKR